MSYFLELLGPAEITMPGLETGAWRLAHYMAVVDMETIEKAVVAVHRRRQPPRGKVRNGASHWMVSPLAYAPVPFRLR